MSGKGDKRRPGKAGAYEEGYDAINWGLCKVAPKKRTVQGVLIEDYTRSVEWVVPDLKTILAADRCGTCKTNPAEPTHSCPYQHEINGNEADDYCDCCVDCRYECSQAV